MTTLLDGLDEGQREVAEALLGPVCVLAGAGAGKTRTITHRIAHGVAMGVYTPARVMALTFTSRAAAELRSRLRVLGAGGVQARTFHAAALSQLSYFWPQLVGGTVPRLVEGKARVLAHAAERLRLTVDTATLRDLSAEIEWRKVSALSLEDYASAARTRVLPGQLTLEQTVALLEEYEGLKDQRRQIDFEDVLLATAGMLESEPAMAMQVREQYRFFVVDEYQDVSPLQQRLLELWLGDRSDLCVVGDASQTIYSFAGARAEYLLNFASRWPGATMVRLEDNYRSTTPIVQMANRLMRGRPGALVLRAVAADEAPEPVIDAYPDDMAEARGVATRVTADVEAGIRLSDIAVLFRTNSQSAAIEHALQERGVSVRLRGGKRFFDRPEVTQAVMQLRAASVSIAGEPLFKSVSDVLRSLGWSAEPPSAPGAVRERWESLDTLARLVDEAPPGCSFRQFTDDLLARQQTHHEPEHAAVTLATLHSVKGLEWESVHLMGLAEGLVPLSYAVGHEAIDEERRLLYVGITRARQRLRLSWARSTAGRIIRREPSRFLAEIGMRSRDAVPVSVP
ncbi:ATP-dependent helicase [Rathayibacter toxicus]|uniref:DNA 3'-5' helicase n=1 Tax=Rathayibacter toxicus TaxID=145458 RepID=A0A0C5BGI8_9MICO|nr:ATP-dependent helicase [Rathayibacter toxicus]AJM77335.1 ATP-dependent DNA helicase [Rathayibacter toxicus]ALS56786.1 ATP-dependent DNA helicase [Rathayibacter toxicus]KKM46368.1 ATP-dependent DNA helicase [Rathayibacter toxicus]PPG23351.1 ATP-dependent helicase [Rathayibacter toxicus]PPG47935.1 ATP-dependent helicase [Rathayibacter toxicus]